MDRNPSNHNQIPACKYQTIFNLNNKNYTPQSLDLDSTSSSTNTTSKRETQSNNHNQIPSIFCRFHASKDIILPHAFKDFRDRNNPQAPNYLPTYSSQSYHNTTPTPKTRGNNQNLRLSNTTAHAPPTNVSIVGTSETHSYGANPDYYYYTTSASSFEKFHCTPSR